MKAMIIGMLAETSVHPGSGQDSGFVDLPVAREVATDYPVIVGSSLKGALRERAREELQEDGAEVERVFGKQDEAGHLLVGDARLVLLPIRSLIRSFCWVTCPHLLERLSRDKTRALGRDPGNEDLNVAEGSYLGDCGTHLFLEERQFERKGGIPRGVVEALSELVPHKQTRERLSERLVVLHDNDFTWFARYGLAVQARNVLHEEKKTSMNLWYEETLPPDSLFYSLVAERRPKALESLEKLFVKSSYLQVGGNETVGQGWFALTFLNGGSK